MRAKTKTKYRGPSLHFVQGQDADLSFYSLTLDDFFFPGGAEVADVAEDGGGEEGRPGKEPEGGEEPEEEDGDWP